MDDPLTYFPALLQFFLLLGLFVLVLLIFLCGYLFSRWLKVGSKLVCLGSTLLCVPIVFWLWLLIPVLLDAHDTSVRRAIFVRVLNDAFTAPPPDPWIAGTVLSMAMGLVLRAIGKAMDRRTKRRSDSTQMLKSH